MDAAVTSSGWTSDMLRESRELAVIQLSEHGGIVGWFGAAEHLFGFTASEMTGQPFDRLLVQQDRDAGIAQMELALARQTGRAEDDRWLVRKDGGTFWASGVMVPHCDPAGRLLGFFKLLRDRTDLRIRYDSLHQRVAALESLLARCDERQRVLLHELRNVVAPMITLGWLMRKAPEEAASPGRLEGLQQQIHLLRRLVEDAAAAPPSRVDSLKLQTLDLKDLVSTLGAGTAEQCRRRQQSFELIVPKGAVVVEADRDRVHQMILNLLSNAMKFTPRHGRIALSLSRDDAMAVVKVQDDGAGIAPGDLASIVQILTREPTSPANATRRFGLGLSIVKEIATAHGGFVEARSAGKGKGSEFVLQLPLRQER